MKTLLAVSLILLSGCALPVDPCPTPPEAHLDVWRPVTTKDGLVLGYVCGP